MLVWLPMRKSYAFALRQNTAAHAAMARSKKDLDEAANVPFMEDDAPLADKRQDA